MKDHSIRSTRFKWQYLISFLLGLVFLILYIITVRAALGSKISAAGAFSNPTAIFSTTSTNTNPAAIPLLTQTPPAVGTEKPAEIDEISRQAGWEILVPGQLPEGYHFQSAYFDSSHQMVTLTYLVTRPLPDAADPSLTVSKIITFNQAKQSDFIPMQIAPEMHVEKTRVNDQPAFYGMGAWDAEFVKDGKDPNGGEIVSTWRNDLNIKNLHWQADELYLVLISDDEAVSQQELIDMASHTGQ